MGSVVEYGPLRDCGGVVRVVDCEGAYEDSEYCEETCERVAVERGGREAWSSVPMYDFAEGFSYGFFGVTVALIGEVCWEDTDGGAGALATPA